MTAHLIKLETLRELADAGSVQETVIRGRRGGFELVARIGTRKSVLATKQGHVRVFASSDAASRVLRQVGIVHTTLDMSHYEEGRLRPGRPDVVLRSAAAAAALSHDSWFREQVEGTLQKLESGEQGWIEHDAMFDELEAYAASEKH